MLLNLNIAVERSSHKVIVISRLMAVPPFYDGGDLSLVYINYEL